MKQPASLCLFALAVCITSTPTPAQAPSETTVSALVQDFYKAEKGYDSVALAKLISDRYVEVSPRGEVDAHDRFLNFYKPDQKTEWPPMQLSEEQVRVFGDTAIDILKITYTMPAPGGGTHPMDIRATFTAQREHGTWKLLGAQFTTIYQPPAGK